MALLTYAQIKLKPASGHSCHLVGEKDLWPIAPRAINGKIQTQKLSLL